MGLPRTGIQHMTVPRYLQTRPDRASLAQGEIRHARRSWRLVPHCGPAGTMLPPKGRAYRWLSDMFWRATKSGSPLNLSSAIGLPLRRWTA